MERLSAFTISPPNAKKWNQVAATIEDSNVVIKTKRSGIVTIVTDSVK
jgi:hypothetical protein